jgi:hypothetical protein
MDNLAGINYGDLVWAKNPSRSSYFWPGVLVDHASPQTPVHARCSPGKGRALVGFFGPTYGVSRRCEPALYASIGASACLRKERRLSLELSPSTLRVIDVIWDGLSNPFFAMRPLDAGQRLGLLPRRVWGRIPVV